MRGNGKGTSVASLLRSFVTDFLAFSHEAYRTSILAYGSIGVGTGNDTHQR